MEDRFLKTAVSLGLLIITIFTDLPSFALSHDWIRLPKSEYGVQYWDKNIIRINKDGSIRIYSKFVPTSTSNIISEILYTMDINCAENSFRDVAIGSKEFNEYENDDLKWKKPNGDKLIISVINQVCNS